MPNKKILIVEDEEPILRLLVEQFKQSDFEVLSAKDGEEGLVIFEESRPDLIILDLFMPKMDGTTMLKKLRQSGEWGAKVPVIVITNFVTKASRDQVMAHNVSDFIIKTDLKMEDLIKKVKRMVSS